VFRGELIICGVVFLSSVYLYTVASQFKGHQVYGKLGPGIWPELVLISMMALSVLIAIDAIRAWKRSPKGQAPEITLGSGRRVRFFSALILIMGYLLLLKVVGFIALTPLFLVAFMFLLGEKSWPWMIGLSVGMTVIVVLAFTKAMYVPLPRGVGIFHNFSVLFY
jgi:putative tricarboxylic transport membrane protein